MIGDPDFARSLVTTLKIAVVALGIQIPLGLVTALVLDSITRGRRLFLTVILLPMGLAWVIIGLMFRWVFDYSYGMFNVVFRLVGATPVDWLGTADNAVASIILIDIWEMAPACTLIFYAGLQSLPREPIEAAIIDGASRWDVLWRVILPMMRPLILFLLSIRTMDCLRIFDEIVSLTFGGPAQATESLSLYIYRKGFRYLDVGVGAAASVLFTLMILGLVIVYILMLYRQEVGEA